MIMHNLYFRMFSDVNNHRHIFLFIINPKRTKQIQSSFDLEQPIKDINGQNIQENLNLQKTR